MERNIGGKVIINTNNYSEELEKTYTEQITNDGGNGIILFSENMVMISQKDEEIVTNKYSYAELFEDTFEEDIEFNKQDVMNYLNNIPYIQYFMMYSVTYFVSMFIIMAVNILVMSAVGLLYVKIMKLNVKYANVLSMSIYANTIAVLLNIVYYLIQVLFTVAIPYFDVVYISIPYIYLIKALFEIRQKNNQK